ncbi:MAG: hypothetical protein Q9196_006990, partial [Gyalolechia fulgens]
MPQPLHNDAALLQPPQRPEMDVTTRQESPAGRHAAPRSSYKSTVAAKPAGSHTQNKKSLDYVLKTGLAGGMAGCA